MEIQDRELIDRLRKKSLMIACPMARRPAATFMFSMMQTIMATTVAGLQIQYHILVGISDLSYARNSIASAFMESDLTDIIWVDDDITWPPEAIFKLWDNEKDVIGGAYAKKTMKPLPDGRMQKEITFCLRDFETEVDTDGTFTVRGMGLGFLKVSRDAMEKIGDAYPRIKRSPEMDKLVNDEKANFYRFFHFDGFGNSEDFYFCDLWRNLGGKIWVDPSISLGHVGDYEYRVSGDFSEMIGKSLSKTDK